MHSFYSLVGRYEMSKRKIQIFTNLYHWHNPHVEYKKSTRRRKSHHFKNSRFYKKIDCGNWNERFIVNERPLKCKHRHRGFKSIKLILLQIILEQSAKSLALQNTHKEVGFLFTNKSIDTHVGHKVLCVHIINHCIEFSFINKRCIDHGHCRRWLEILNKIKKSSTLLYTTIETESWSLELVVKEL